MSSSTLYARLIEDAIHHDDPDLLTRALAQGHSPNREARGGEPLLHTAIVRMRSGGTEIIERLLAAGADIEARHGDRTALMVACASGKARAVEVLLAHGANMDAVDNDGWTAAMWATAHSSAYYGGECVQLLVRAGAQLEVASHTGSTLLMLAAGKGMKSVVEEMIERGADVCRRNSNKHRASDCALAGVYRTDSHRECAKLLREVELVLDVEVGLQVETPVSQAPTRPRRL